MDNNPGPTLAERVERLEHFKARAELQLKNVEHELFGPEPDLRKPDPRATVRNRVDNMEQRLAVNAEETLESAMRHIEKLDHIEKLEAENGKLLTRISLASVALRG